MNIFLCWCQCMHYNWLKYLQVFISKNFVDEMAFVLLKMCIFIFWCTKDTVNKRNS